MIRCSFLSQCLGWCVSKWFSQNSQELSGLCNSAFALLSNFIEVLNLHCPSVESGRIKFHLKQVCWWCDGMFWSLWILVGLSEDLRVWSSARCVGGSRRRAASVQRWLYKPQGAAAMEKPAPRDGYIWAISSQSDQWDYQDRIKN